jgi:putative copper export protein/methionine-rich copper-binding protein CopC
MTLRRPTSRSLAAAAIAVLLVPSVLLAHQSLRASSPAAGATVDAVPAELRLTFAEPVRLDFTELSVRGPAGALALAELRRAGDDPRVLVARVTGGWHPGEFTVHWVTVGADGHRTNGTFAFTVAPDAAGLPEPEPEPAEPEAVLDPDPDDDPAAGAHDPRLFPHSPTFEPGSTAYVAIRALLFLALIALVGAVALRLVVLPIAGLRWGQDARLLRDGIDAGAARLGLAAAVLLLVAALARLWAQSASLFGTADALDPDRLRLALGLQPWGASWVLQLGAALVAMAAFALVLAGRRGAWALAAAAAVVAVATPALSGHAVGAGGLAWLAVPADAIHVIAAGGWIGGLFALLVVGLPTALRLEAGRRGPAAAALVHSFSPTAVAFTGTLVATGLLSAWIQLGDVTALWTTDYGRTLLVKVGIFSAVAAAGAYNLLRVRPALGEVRGAERLRRSGTIELALALGVIVVTAILVAVPPPTM